MRVLRVSSLRRRGLVYGFRFILVPSGGFRVGWPGSLVSASPVRSSPPSIRAGVFAEHPMLYAPQAGKTNRFTDEGAPSIRTACAWHSPGNSRAPRPTFNATSSFG
jgi:hypothetical protein